MAMLTGIFAAEERVKNAVRPLSVSYTHLDVYKRQLQDPLSFRCASAIHGSVLDVLVFVRQVLEKQLNACLLYTSERTDERSERITQTFNNVNTAEHRHRENHQCADCLLYTSRCV